MNTPLPRLTSMISANCASDCSGVMRRLARPWVSLADMTRLISSTSHDSARSQPFTLGTSTVYSTPATRWMPRITSSASRRLGMALGEVKEVTSILARPVWDRRSIRAILSSVGMKEASIWKPSRVATSWI